MQDGGGKKKRFALSFQPSGSLAQTWGWCVTFNWRDSSGRQRRRKEWSQWIDRLCLAPDGQPDLTGVCAPFQSSTSVFCVLLYTEIVIKGQCVWTRQNAHHSLWGATFRFSLRWFCLTDARWSFNVGAALVFISLLACLTNWHFKGLCISLRWRPKCPLWTSGWWC